MKPVAMILSGLIVYSTAVCQDIVKQSESDTVKVKLWTIYPGYVITRSNDTVRGYLMLKNLVANQDKVCFYNSPEGNEKDRIKYKPKDIKAYKAGPRFYESFKFRPGVSTYSANDANAYHFVIRTLDGPITLYKWFYETTGESEKRVELDTANILNSKVDLTFSEENLHSITLAKFPNGEFVNFEKMLIGFKKKMSKLVADYPELAKKIADKEEGYRWADIEKIVKEYNNWYKEKP